MNYWLLTSEYPPFFGGGIGTYCAITVKMLSSKGHVVSVFVCDPSVSNYVVENKDGVRIIRFGTSRTKSSGFLGHVTNISYEFADIVKHFIDREGKPDCIEAQEYLGIAYYILQYKYLLYDWCSNIPVVITMHSPSFLYMEYNQVSMYRYPNYWVCEMERFCLQAADHVVSPSHYMLSQLKERFQLHHQRVTIIPNPFDAIHNGIIPVKADNVTPDEIVFFGKLTPQKGAFRLMKYFEELWDKGFKRPLYLLGGQDIVYHPMGMTMGDIIRKQYRKYIDAGLLKLEDRIKPTAIAVRLSKAEVVIVPSNNDNLPYVVFEMMALGKIVLVSKQGGQSEVVENGIDGFVFDHNDPQTFFDQLKFILQLDKDQKESISARAMQKVSGNYNPDVIYERKIALLQDLRSNNYLATHYPMVRKLELKPRLPMETHGTNGKLSIVVPYYNMGEYIDETISSLEQTDYPNKEIIIVNDGSTDLASLAKLDAFRQRKKIRVIDVPNGGVAKARNIGAQLADGEFLAFLDADDTVQPEYYSMATKVFMQYENVHFAGCWVQYFGKSGKVWPTFMPEPPLILYHNLVNSSGLVYKRAAYLASGGNDTGMAFQGLEDYESVVSMISCGFGGVVLPQPLFNYRVRTDSMIRAISVDKKLILCQEISSKHKQFYSNFAADLFNLLNANGPGIYLDNPTADHHLADKLPFGGRLSGQIIALMKRNAFVKAMAYKVYKLLKK